MEYSHDWFKERAFAGLRKIEEGVWDYSDSLLLYLPGSDDAYEAVQDTETEYHKLVTAPERKYLGKMAAPLVQELPNEFEYIDLGPGTEHKEQFIFDAAREQGKSFIYRPVDISDRYLRLAKEYALVQGPDAYPLKASFEELPQKLGEEKGQRFISIGLTYSNYNPEDILQLLKVLVGQNGTAFINAHIRERTDMERIRAVYMDVADSMIAAKLRLIGLDPEHDISAIDVTDGVKIWHTLKNSTPELEKRSIKAGDKLLTLQSLRPTRESLEKDIRGVFPNYQMFDTGGPFVGALLKA